MQLTKHAHACVTLEKDGDHLVVDPGSFTPDAAELVSGTTTVLITHEHPDHFEESVMASAIASRPDLQVFGPASVMGSTLRETASRQFCWTDSGQVPSDGCGLTRRAGAVRAFGRGRAHR